jgi:hypothetical protein
MRKRPASKQLEPSSNCRHGHWLLLRPDELRIPCPSGGEFVVEYDICLELSKSSARKLNLAKPLALTPERDEHGRYDLRVQLAGGSAGKHWHTHYHRVLGLALTATPFSSKGRKVSPRLVSVADYGGYDVHHLDGDPLNCRLRNLQSLPVCRHRGAERDGWNTRAVKRPAAAMVKV